MKRFLVFCLVIVILVGWPAPSVLAQEPEKEPPQEETLAPTDLGGVDTATLNKISPALLKQLTTGSNQLADSRDVTFIVHLREQADLEQIAVSASANQRRQSVVATLQETARVSQAPLQSLIAQQLRDQHIVRYTSYWIFNGMAVEGDLRAALALASRPEVATLSPNRVHHLPATPESVSPESLDSDLWNIDKIGAESVWQTYGITGEGVVVANMDSGVDWTHAALQSSYRGYDAGNPLASVHDYNWLDVTGTYPNAPGPNEAYIGTQSDHGTHTMGSIVGQEPDGSQVYGVAPGARWIAAKVFSDAGSTTDEWLHAGFQWMLAPTDLNGENPDPTKAPDIVNNSWGNDFAGDTEFAPDLVAWKASGILSTWAGGNEGPGAGTINAPASIPGALAVGATTMSDDVAGFSSRGPSPYGEIKPDVSAPGVSIVSTIAGGETRSWQGTSMATPHVSGLAALLYEASGHSLSITETQFVITSTVVDLGDAGKDNEFGWGRIDALAAVEYVMASGTLSGTVTDAGTGLGVAQATVSIADAGQELKTVATDSQGRYQARLPEGVVDVSATAFGYVSDTVTGVTIVTDTVSTVDIAIAAVPTGTLEVVVIEGGHEPGTDVALTATVRLVGHDMERAVDGDGYLAWNLPEDTYTLAIMPAAPGHYGQHIEDVHITAGAIVPLRIELEPAPTILLVDGDAWLSDPAGQYYRASLDSLMIGYDVYSPSERSDVPSLATLSDYEVIIWSNAEASPGYMGGWPDLVAYLDAGGALLISGQDIGYWDDDGSSSSFYARYLYAQHTADDSGDYDLSMAQDGPWQGLGLAINGASSAMNQVSPDAITPTEPMARAIATYGNGSVAALGIDACAYRAIYAGFGLEGIGPESQRTLAIERAIEWLAQPPSQGLISAEFEQASHTAEPGSSVDAALSVLNRTAVSQSLSVEATCAWPTSVRNGDGGETARIEAMAPCASYDLVAEVDVPADALVGEEHLLTLTLTPDDPSVQAVVISTTITAQNAWRVVGNLASSIHRAAAVADGCRILVAGGVGDGYTLDEVFAVDAATAAVTHVATLPTATCNATAVMLGGELYVIGGYDLESYVALDTVQVLDTATSTWRDGPTLPMVLSGAAAASLGSDIYIFGGNTGGTEALNTAFVSDGTGGWQLIAPMPFSADFCQAVAHDGVIYVAGGWSSMSQLARYDPSTDSWLSLAPMSHGRQSFVFVSDGAYLYAAGGGQGWDGIPYAERYDPATDTWQALPELVNSNRSGTCGGLASGRLVVISGTGDAATPSIETLDVGVPLASSWLGVSSPTAQSGDLMTYTLVLKNPSPEGVTTGWAITLPVGIDEVQSAPPGSVTSGGSPFSVTWSGDLTAESSKRFEIVTRVGYQIAYGSEMDAQALVSGVPCMPNGLSLSTSSRLVEPSLHTSSIAASRSAASIGDTITYQIEVVNPSPFDIDPVEVVNPLPPELDIVAGTIEGAMYASADRSVRWQGQLPRASSVDAIDWRDASGGLRLDLADDACSTLLPLEFDFDFYGETFDEIVVSSNGLVTFGGCHSSFTNEMLPSSAVDYGCVAPFWDDLAPNRGGDVYFDVLGQAPNRVAVVSWEDVPSYGTTDTQTFQVLLFEGSHGIVCQYLDMNGERGEGWSATVGLQSPDGTQADVYLYNGEPSGHLLANGAVVALDQPSTAWGTSHTISYRARVNGAAVAGETLSNDVTITGGARPFTCTVATSLVENNGIVYLPMVFK